MKYILIAILTILILGFFKFGKAIRSGLKQSKSDSKNLLEFGKLIFKNHSSEFEKFYTSFQTDRARFISDNNEILGEYAFEYDKLTALEVVYIFGDQNGYIETIDWRGEENKRELETSCEKIIQRKIEWSLTNEYRAKYGGEEPGDGINIIKLFKTVDKDLQNNGYRLMFLNLGWDAYVFTLADEMNYAKIIDLHINGIDTAVELKE